MKTQNEQVIKMIEDVVIHATDEISFYLMSGQEKKVPMETEIPVEVDGLRFILMLKKSPFGWLLYGPRDGEEKDFGQDEEFHLELITEQGFDTFKEGLEVCVICLNEAFEHSPNAAKEFRAERREWRQKHKKEVKEGKERGIKLYQRLTGRIVN